MTVIARDGREVLLTPSRSRGWLRVEGMPRPGEFSLPAGLRLRLEASGKPVAAIVPRNGSTFLWVQDPAKPGSWQQVDLPAAPAADPIAWGNGVLIPGRDSRAYLIDPFTGRSLAEPFVPKFDRDHQGTWLSPARLDQDTVVLADDVGRVYRVELKTAPVPRLVGEAQAPARQRIIAGPASTGSAVIVVTADRQVRALSTRDLSPVGSWALEAPLSGRSTGIAEGCFVMDRAGGVMAFGRDGQRIWSIKLEAGPVGSPLVQGQSVWFLTSDGSLHVRARSDGAELDRIVLGILPTVVYCRSETRNWSRPAGGRSARCRPFSGPPAGLEMRDRKANAVKRLVCSGALTVATALLISIAAGVSMARPQARIGRRRRRLTISCGGSVRSRHPDRRDGPARRTGQPSALAHL